MNATRLLVDKLVGLGATLRKPASPGKVVATERKLQCRFPAGVCHFYTTCDGVSDPTADWIWDFFSLDVVVERTNEPRKLEYLAMDDGKRVPYHTLVAFCDVMIDAPTYLFCGDPSSDHFGHFYADYGDQGYNGWKVADSYEKFVELFVANCDDIHLLPEEE